MWHSIEQSDSRKDRRVIDFKSLEAQHGYPDAVFYLGELLLNRLVILWNQALSEDFVTLFVYLNDCFLGNKLVSQVMKVLEQILVELVTMNFDFGFVLSGHVCTPLKVRHICSQSMLSISILGCLVVLLLISTQLTHVDHS